MYCHYETVNDGTSLGISKIILYNRELTQRRREPRRERYKTMDLITEYNNFTWECNQLAVFPPLSLETERVKAHANGRSIVGHQHATLLGQTCCVRLHGTTTMLALVACSLKPIKLLGPYIRTQHYWPTTRNNVVTCCVRLHRP